MPSFKDGKGKTSAMYEKKLGRRVFSAAIPADLYEEFKAVCAERGESVRDRVEHMMRAWVKRRKREKRKGNVGGTG